VTQSAATSYTLHVKNAEGCEATSAVTVTVSVGGSCCDAPNTTAVVNFTAFNPCTANVGDYWTLQDTREPTNPQTYTVKLMADSRIWMVQDLKFGDLCGTDFMGSTADQTGNVSSIGTYYGDCTTKTDASTPSARGYYYDWAAAINKSGAYSGGSDVGCVGTDTGTSGTAPGACQGICPVGWHIPTGSSGEYQALHDAMKSSCSNDACWDGLKGSAWAGVLGGSCDSGGLLGNQGSNANYWSSTYYSSPSAYLLYFYSGTVYPGTSNGSKNYGRTVRCVRNY
jgi:uncharacterized protein (TIGR02145 family)